MAQGKTITFTKVEEDNLQHLADLTHLFHHRNKNQHRRSHWWRHLDIFRRQLKALVAEVHTLNAVPTTNLAKAKKKASDESVRQKVRQRLSFWQDAMVPRWERAFSQVIADGRFAVLGLVLLAALSEVCSITGVTAHFEDLGQAEVDRVLRAFGDEWHGSGSDLPKTPDGTDARASTAKALKSLTTDEDVGEAVDREASSANEQSKPVAEGLTSEDQTRPDVTERKSSKRSASAAAESSTTKKRKRGGKALDDLFAGLI